MTLAEIREPAIAELTQPRFGKLLHAPEHTVPMWEGGNETGRQQRKNRSNAS
ncbi:MAG: hypothetical protein J0H48_09585 [Nitrosospira multiformis]|nr:hypothetical protein [Nitrosospira multiformis]